MQSSLALLNFPFGLASQDTTLVVIFGFVICLVVIKQIFRFQRAKLWHDTARMAMEKGQPIPGGEPDKWTRGESFKHRFEWRFGQWYPWRLLSRGLGMIAIGIALYFALPVNNQAWALLPALIGVANLITWVFVSLRSDKSPDRDGPA